MKTIKIFLLSAVLGAVAVTGQAFGHTGAVAQYIDQSSLTVRTTGLDDPNGYFTSRPWDTHVHPFNIYNGHGSAWDRHKDDGSRGVWAATNPNGDIGVGWELHMPRSGDPFTNCIRHYNHERTVVNIFQYINSNTRRQVGRITWNKIEGNKPVRYATLRNRKLADGRTVSLDRGARYRIEFSIRYREKRRSHHHRFFGCLAGVYSNRTFTIDRVIDNFIGGGTPPRPPAPPTTAFRTIPDVWALNPQTGECVAGSSVHLGQNGCANFAQHNPNYVVQAADRRNAPEHSAVHLVWQQVQDSVGTRPLYWVEHKWTPHSEPSYHGSGRRINSHNKQTTIRGLGGRSFSFSVRPYIGNFARLGRRTVVNYEFPAAPVAPVRGLASAGVTEDTVDLDWRPPAGEANDGGGEPGSAGLRTASLRTANVEGGVKAYRVYCSYLGINTLDSDGRIIRPSNPAYSYCHQGRRTEPTAANRISVEIGGQARTYWAAGSCSNNIRNAKYITGLLGNREYSFAVVAHADANCAKDDMDSEPQFVAASTIGGSRPVFIRPLSTEVTSRGVRLKWSYNNQFGFRGVLLYCDVPSCSGEIFTLTGRAVSYPNDENEFYDLASPLNLDGQSVPLLPGQRYTFLLRVLDTSLVPAPEQPLSAGGLRTQSVGGDLTAASALGMASISAGQRVNVLPHAQADSPPRTYTPVLAAEADGLGFVVMATTDTTATLMPSYQGPGLSGVRYVACESATACEEARGLLTDDGDSNVLVGLEPASVNYVRAYLGSEPEAAGDADNRIWSPIVPFRTAARGVSKRVDEAILPKVLGVINRAVQGNIYRRIEERQKADGKWK